MKKKFTFGLLLAVLTIWSFIIYRLLFIKKEVTSVVVENRKQNPIKVKDQIVYELTANYRDPFFDKPRNLTPNISVSIAQREIKIPINESAESPICRYIGLIKNQSNKKIITLINFNEKDIMMEEGESKDGLILIKNHGNYIVIQLEGITQSIYK